ncbi:uncharacterized protein VTP21DRAFT_6233 [Calcarisporiella thermophila]|uniref:uncharacterized protein n=1 Tax=Calcarisporiella thermophila TaxID=911321 RepID=UPI003743E31C
MPTTYQRQVARDRQSASSTSSSSGRNLPATPVSYRTPDSSGEYRPRKQNFYDEEPQWRDGMEPRYRREGYRDEGIPKSKVEDLLREMREQHEQEKKAIKQNLLKQFESDLRRQLSTLQERAREQARKEVMEEGMKEAQGEERKLRDAAAMKVRKACKLLKAELREQNMRAVADGEAAEETIRREDQMDEQEDDPFVLVTRLSERLIERVHGARSGDRQKRGAIDAREEAELRRRIKDAENEQRRIEAELNEAKARLRERDRGRDDKAQEMEELRTEKRRLEQVVADLRQDLNNAGDNLRASETRLLASEREAERIRRDLERDLREAEDVIKGLRLDVKEAKDRMDELERSGRRWKEEKIELEKQLSEGTDVQDQLRRMEASLNKLKEEASTAKREKSEAERELMERLEELTQVRRDLDDAIHMNELARAKLEEQEEQYLAHTRELDEQHEEQLRSLTRRHSELLDELTTQHAQEIERLRMGTKQAGIGGFLSSWGGGSAPIMASEKAAIEKAATEKANKAKEEELRLAKEEQQLLRAFLDQEASRAQELERMLEKARNEMAEVQNELARVARKK